MKPRERSLRLDGFGGALSLIPTEVIASGELQSKAFVRHCSFRVQQNLSRLINNGDRSVEGK